MTNIDVKLRFKRCVKIKLKDLRKTSILYLIASVAPTAYYMYLMLNTSIIYYVVWFLTVYGFLGLFDLVWYIDTHRECKRLADNGIYECNSECYYQLCKESYCNADAYTSCIDECRQIFNDTS